MGLETAEAVTLWGRATCSPRPRVPSSVQWHGLGLYSMWAKRFNREKLVCIFLTSQFSAYLFDEIVIISIFILTNIFEKFFFINYFIIYMGEQNVSGHYFWEVFVLIYLFFCFHFFDIYHLSTCLSLHCLSVWFVGHWRRQYNNPSVSSKINSSQKFSVTIHTKIIFKFFNSISVEYT